MSKFKSYKRKQIAELREVTANDRVSFERNGYLAVFNDVTPTSTTRVSISEEDSHAGISLTWIKDVCKCDTITSLKHLFSNPIEAVHLLDFNMISGYDPYGDTKSQSPLWIRPKSLLLDVVDGHLQVVGHTHTKIVTRQDNVWFCDSLPNSYLIIEDGRFIIKEIEE